MRITAILILAACLQVSARTHGQHVTLQAKNVPLEVIFKAIKDQTGYFIVSSREMLMGARPITISALSLPLTDFLSLAFKDQPFSYTIDHNSIFLVKKKAVVMSSGEQQYLIEDLTLIRVRVVDSVGRPLSGASVSLKNGKQSGITDAEGIFSINAGAGDVLVFSFVGFETSSYKITSSTPSEILISLKATVTQLEDVEITVNTGYQNIHKERSAGSFTQVSNELINRTVSTSLIDRLDGIVSGLVLNRNTSRSNQSQVSAITIRGRSTIYANPNPLIVIDNFPYNGNLSTINPADVESITVLKDAAAASVWGAFSGNGVIVITTKKGKINQPLSVSVSSNLMIGEKPDLFYMPRLSSANIVDIERDKYFRGGYNSQINSTRVRSLYPSVDILARQAKGQLTEAQANAELDDLRNQDSRSEMSNYFYRGQINQQYNINFSGGSKYNQYYLGIGFDKNLDELIGNGLDRLTVNAKQSYQIIPDKLSFTTNLVYSRYKTENNGLSDLAFPYLKIADENGNPLEVQGGSLYRRYTDTVGGGKLLDWTYKPLAERDFRDFSTVTLDYRINSELRYQITKSLSIQGNYQFSTGNSVNNSIYKPEAFYPRDLINTFSQIDPVSKAVTRAIPVGGLLDRIINNYTGNNLRIQANFSSSWNKHAFDALAGYEVSDVEKDYSLDRFYGYDPETGGSGVINPLTDYPTLPIGTVTRIDNRKDKTGTAYRFLSYFGNVGYTYNNRYSINGSIRKDESNIFGVNSNQKGVPLWSVGGVWNIAKEKFYKIDWLPYLRMRLTTGYNGNVDYTLSSQVVILNQNVSYPNVFEAPYASLSNPPNPDLRWERIRSTNIGIDFATRNRRVTGTLEFFRKDGLDIIGVANMDQATGVSTFKGNSANTRVNGADLSINVKISDRKLGWDLMVQGSYAKDKVTKYLFLSNSVSNGLTPSVNPVIGNPLFSIYSLPWAGLDNTGSPMVYFEGKASKEYENIFYSNKLENVQYHGPVNPTLFGNLLNTIHYQSMTLSFNIVYRVGHYFRNTGVDYSSILIGTYTFSNEEYEKRWKNPGDELKTNTPVFDYAGNSLKDQVYTSSSLFVEKGDNIRLKDIRLSYSASGTKWKPLKDLQIYGYINNAALLWKANSSSLDPDYLFGYPPPRTYTIGATLKF